MNKSVFFFFSFSLIIIFILLRSLTWNFMLCFAMLKRCLMQKMKKIYPCNTSHANFSFICAPKPVGRIDLSWIERVKLMCAAKEINDVDEKLLCRTLVFFKPNHNMNTVYLSCVRFCVFVINVQFEPNEKKL